MGSTFQIRGSASTSITLNFKSISEDISSSKMKIGVGNGDPYYIRFGHEKSISVTGQVFSSTDHAKLMAWNGDIILECTASDIPEIVVSTGTPTDTNLLIIDKIKISRKGGYLNMWDYSITFIQGDLTKLKRWT